MCQGQKKVAHEVHKNHLIKSIIKKITLTSEKFSRDGTVGVFMQLSEYIATLEVFDRELKLSWRV